MDIKDIFAAMLIFIGLLIFLIMLHIITIESAGDTASVLNTFFQIFLRIYEAFLIFAGVYLIIHYLKWLVWSVTTPKWMKEKIKNNKGGSFQ